MEIQKIKVVKNVELVEIKIYNTQEKIITHEHIEQAINLLYGSRNAEIVNKIPLEDSLTFEAVRDYEWELKVRGEYKVCYNFGCCFIDSEDCEKLAEGNIKKNILDTLRILRGPKFDEYPMFFNDYAERIIKAYKEFLAIEKVFD